MRVEELCITLVADLVFTLAERGTSKLSTISTTVSENQTIYGTVPPEEVAGPSVPTAEEKAEVDVPMDVEQPDIKPSESIVLPIPDLEPLPEPVSQPAPETVPIPIPVPIPEFVPIQPVPIPEFVPVSRPVPEPDLEPEPEPEPAPVPEVHEETQSELEARIAAIPRDRYTNIIAVDGRIIIEELDTPATRREKASRRKAEKASRRKAEKKAAAAAAAAAALPTRDKGDGHESDLSSLSELESEEEGEGEGPTEQQPVGVPPPIAGPSRAPLPAEPGVVILPEGKTLEGGTLGGCCHVMGQRHISR